MLALSSIATSVVSGTMVAGSAMWAISNVAAEAQEEVQTVTITDNEDGRLTTTPAGSLIIMNLQGTSAGRWLIGPGTTHNVLADVQIDSLSITNGSSSATYNFAGDITGDGVFERTNNASASKQTYVFTGDMSQYSGEMKLLKQNDASTFKFIGNQSGTGAITIVAGNSIVVDGATMNNSSITSAGTFTVQGTSFIAGDVSSTGTLKVNGMTTFAGDVNCGGTLLVSEDTEITSYGAFTFGENAVINLARANAVTDAQRTQTYTIFSSAGAGTSNFSELSIADLTGLVTAGRTWSFNADGTLVGVLSNNSLTHSASGDFTWNTTASSFSKGEETVTFTQGDDVTFTGTGTKISFGESLQAQRVTVAESANITISGSGSGSLTLEEAVVYGTLNLNKGGNPGNGAFTGAIDVYGTLNLNTGDVTGWSDSLGIKSIDIYEGGEMVVNTTANQTGAGIVINLQGGSISGVANSNFDLGYGGTLHGYSTISALAADGATAAQPTVSTISGATITLRQNHTTISVAENARLDILSGILVKGNKSDLNGEGAVPSHLLAGLVKTGAGELRLSGNNTYTQATTVAEGTLTLTGGAALASSSVAVNRGAVFKLDTAADTSINYANQISGSGLLLKTGAGSASIGGLADSFAGHIDLQQGTLSVGSPVVISSGRELSLGMTGAVLNSSLSLGDGKLSIDYSGSGAATSLNNSALTLLGGTQLQLSSLGNGDGKTYELFAGIGSLLGRDGNALVLDDTNNAISNYFDSTRPGTGFWAGATLQLTDAGTLQLVLHNETVKEAITITFRQTNPSAYQYYAGIAFEDISNDSDSYAYGGAIYGSTITLSDNGSVTFSGNTASSSDDYARGGAIYGDRGSTITLSNNGSVTFSGNTASSSDDYAYGGAIYGDRGSTITLSNNGSVTFSGNTASSSSSSAYGGAIYGGGDSTITLSDNGSVSFSGNTASASSYAYGGAIYGLWDSTITLSDNGSVSFSGNTASASSSAYGGAIYGDGDITLSDNGSVSFSGNTASASSSSPYAYGGAIYGDSSSTITLSNNGSVVFEGNTASASSRAYGGAIDGDTITLSDNGSVSFSGNTASSSDSYAYGGAIYGDSSSTITLSNNGSVVFEGNTASSSSSRAEGGAIYGDGDITLSDNGSVSFSGNTASSSDSDAYGGAIEGDVTMEGNGSVSFSGNTASSSSSSAFGGAVRGGTITLSNNGSVVFEGNTASSSSYSAGGGAIYGDDVSAITLSNNGSVSFIGNTASASSSAGGAISGGYDSSITLSNNGSVVFEGNTASASSSSGGGAISGRTITLSNNGSVTFSGNTASSSDSSNSFAYGGAIYGDVTMEGNGDVSFIGNTASSSSAATYGGAIYGGTGSFITLSNNKGSITFIGNTASSSGYRADGGAIDGSTITLSNNKGSITFSGNTAESASSYSGARGGAIYGDSITLSDNGRVVFEGNKASDSSSACGGAIFAIGNLSIRNNDSVEFYQNAEVVNGNTYRLCSIYAFGGSGDEISLSAAAGKSITFRDSIYIDSGSRFKLNEVYEGTAQLGDIIFTGATTVDDLYTVKGNVAGTEEEIRLSRTSEINTLTELYGGRLRVEEGAIYQGQGITAMEGSGATVRVQNATLSQVGYDLTFNAGTVLEVAGNSTIRGNVKLLADSLFKMEQAATLSLPETLQADAAKLTVQGTALLAGSSTLNASLTLADGATLDMMSLDAGAVTINGALTFGGKVEMGENLMAILNEMRGWEESVTLFTGIESLVLPQVVTSGDSGRVWVGNVFSNLAGNESYYIDFKADVGALLVVHVPEPTTTSLSLLVLAALAMRRRRG